MTSLWDLFYAFFMVGLCTFGGAPAALPMLRRELIEKRAWCTDSELLDYYAIGQCTPGIILINTATFIGRKQRKTAGAILATIGVITPSLIIISILSFFLMRLSGNPWVMKAFEGIRIVVCALIVNALFKLVKTAKPDIFFLILAVCASVLKFALGLSSVLIILLAIAFGIIYSVSGGKKDE